MCEFEQNILLLLLLLLVLLLLLLSYLFHFSKTLNSFYKGKPEL